MKRDRKASKKYKGVYLDVQEQGTVIYINYRERGKLKWEKIGVESKKCTQRLAAQLREERVLRARHGNDLPANPYEVPTVDELAQIYLEWSEKNKKSADHDKTRYKLHLAPRFADRLVTQVTPVDLENLKSNMLKDKKSPATVKQVLALYRAMHNKGRILLPVMKPLPNPVSDVKMPKVDNARLRVLSYDDVLKLLDALRERSPDSYALVLLAYNLGARFSEIAQLRWKDFDRAHKTMAFQDAKGGTEKVPINGVAMAFLERLGGGEPDGLIVPRRDGEAYKEAPRVFREVANDLFNQGLDLKDRRYRAVFHTVRHTFASELLRGKTSLPAIKTLIRHKSLDMVDRYTKTNDQDLRTAVELLVHAPKDDEKPS